MMKEKITNLDINFLDEELEECLCDPPFFERPEEPITEIDSFVHGHFALGDRVYYIRPYNMYKIKCGTIKQFIWKEDKGLFPYYKIVLDNGDVVEDHELFHTLAEARAEVIEDLKCSLINSRNFLVGLQREIAINERRLATLQSYDEKIKEQKIINAMKQEEKQNLETLPQVSGQRPVKLLMSLYLGDDLPISDNSGWGYGKDDAVVIATENPMEGVGFEYQFVEQRAQLEVLELDELHPEKNHYFESFRRLRQSIKIIGDVHYDIIEAEVTVTDDDDNETKYRTQCWFNVDKLFEGYSKISEKYKKD
ncbi:MAG: hypothetical protein J6X22_07170 [Muribaculaceae bacterium]|nr:hypothetical protein [Muribaculaceae bacterium]